ncbi:MAG: SusD/RagB family nutrient-binding outer membrane lipoprotein [Chitinophagaceae bacterium]
MIVFCLASPSGIPAIQLAASETNFDIADGLNRGFGVGYASDYYNHGIEESMKLFDVNNAAINNFKIKNSFSGNTAGGLTQILEQKYIAFFQNSGRQAYYNYRRAGIPKFDIGPANANNNSIPTRWAYPTNEYSVNTVNLKASLQS